MAEYYLPEGTWTSVLTGEARQGGKWYREKHGYLSIPLYARENSILALGVRDDDAVYDYADGVTLNVYALQDGATAQTVVYSPDNQAELHAQVSRQGGVYRIRLQGQKLQGRIDKCGHYQVRQLLLPAGQCDPDPMPKGQRGDYRFHGISKKHSRGRLLTAVFTLARNITAPPS